MATIADVITRFLCHHKLANVRVDQILVLPICIVCLRRNQRSVQICVWLE